MVQAKIIAFFKPKIDSDEANIWSCNQTKCIEDPEENDGEVLVTYKRRCSQTKSSSDVVCPQDDVDTGKSNVGSAVGPSTGSCSMPKILNKKRKYVQSHLELGQSDFLLHTCSSCGLRYTCGREEDEKVHKAYHKSYLHGIQFKGWCTERVVSAFETTGERIVLVLADDPPTQKRKVQEVAKSMAKDLYCGADWLLNKFYQAYLFISKNRVAGCLIIEQIQRAYNLVPNSVSIRKSSDDSVNEAMRSDLSVSETHKSNSAKHSSSRMRFGDVSFQREIVIRKDTSLTYSQQGEALYTGAILCERDSVPAVCGVRAIWVAPACRRQNVATKLLNAARKNFGIDREVKRSECAFSQPTSLGCAFAGSYCRSMPFLVYNVSC